MGDTAAPDKLKKSLSVSNVWQHAVKETSTGATAPDAVKPLSKEEREARAALIIGRKWRTIMEQQTALSRTRLIERLDLEESVRTGVLRMVLFLCVFFFNLLLTSIDVAPEFKLMQRTNIRCSTLPGLVRWQPSCVHGNFMPCGDFMPCAYSRT